MDIVSEILNGNIKIDWYIVILVIAGGFFQKRYWTSRKPSQAIKTLIVGTIFSLCYIFGVTDWHNAEVFRTNLVGGFVSYALATSFYELIVTHIVDLIKNTFRVEKK